MNPEKLKEILESHRLFLNGDPNGVEANLTGADLTRANLTGANLYRANLDRANLEEANLDGANLEEANLDGANLEEANLAGANLEEANLAGANLTRANLDGANLYGATIDPGVVARRQICPSDSFTAYKKVRNSYILKLSIPVDAKRVGGLVGRKCRADKAFVVEALGSTETEFTSQHDPKFKYTVGQTVVVTDFCDDARIECAAGIHFFITEIEAREY